MRQIQLAVSAAGARLHRRQVGIFYTGKPERQRDGTTILRDAKPVRIGTEGEPDLGGFMPVVITADMVGQTLPIAAIIEIKTPTGRVSAVQAQYIKAARAHGLIAGVARSVADALAILAGDERVR